MLKTFVVKVTPSADGKYLTGECGGQCRLLHRDHARTADEGAIEMAEHVVDLFCSTHFVEFLHRFVADYGPEESPWDGVKWVWIECILTPID